MNFQALQKRAKETKRQEKKTEVKQKDGTVKVIQKYKRKKRFGRSINRRAPARFLLELKRKAEGSMQKWIQKNLRQANITM